MERFWNKVKTQPNGCWLWTAKHNNKGYGMFRWKANNKWTFKLAHRIGYELFWGVSLGTKQANHTCDNPGCVNPYHIKPGTQIDNMQEASVRKRLTGNKFGRRKLTDDQVKELRLMSAFYTVYDLSAMYKITPGHVRKLVRGAVRS